MFTLLPCDATGRPTGPVENLPDALVSACAQSAELYQRIGYEPPWVSYVALEAGRGVGGGAFVGAPKEDMVEMAYFTLDECQGHGYATQTARELVAIARRVVPTMTIRAFTLPETNPSTKILVRLGFTMVGFSHDQDAGEVWEWRTSP